MSLTLYYHPLSSFAQKAVIALYENGTEFTPRIVNFGDDASRAELAALWPIAKIPVLRDDARDRTIPEATIIIEYLAQHHASVTPLVPSDPDLARQTRLRDRFYDLYVAVPMQKIVTDRLRPDGQHDPYGVDEARRTLRTAYDMIARDMPEKRWAMGDTFTMADCAAAPALSYATMVEPLGDAHAHVAAYLRRLEERPSFARALREADPYRHLFPK